MNGRTRTVGEGGVLRAGRWHLDPARCEAGFEVGHLGFVTVRGTAPVLEGEVELGAAGRLVGARVVVGLAAVDTGNPRRDRDLHAPRFLDTDRHPELVAVVRSAEAAPDGWQVAADITARGETGRSDLAIRLTRSDTDSAVVRVEGRLDLRSLGLRIPRLIIARHVDLRATLVAVRG